MRQIPFITNFAVKEQNGFVTRKNRERWRGHWKYVWVEPGLGGENPDIWAFNGDDTICIEVKTSHADFVADQKKW